MDKCRGESREGSEGQGDGSRAMEAARSGEEVGDGAADEEFESIAGTAG